VGHAFTRIARAAGRGLPALQFASVSICVHPRQKFMSTKVKSDSKDRFGIIMAGVAQQTI
jgi:hypothetical protein